jgi:hypothetical protein
MLRLLAVARTARQATMASTWKCQQIDGLSYYSLPESFHFGTSLAIPLLCCSNTCQAVPLVLTPAESDRIQAKLIDS